MHNDQYKRPLYNSAELAAIVEIISTCGLYPSCNSPVLVAIVLEEEHVAANGLVKRVKLLSACSLLGAGEVPAVFHDEVTSTEGASRDNSTTTVTTQRHLTARIIIIIIIVIY